LGGAVTVTQAAADTAVHVQPACVNTVNWPLDAPDPGFDAGGLMEYVQATPA
jgi:hypothetical protein